MKKKSKKVKKKFKKKIRKNFLKKRRSKVNSRQHSRPKEQGLFQSILKVYKNFGKEPKFERKEREKQIREEKIG